MEKIAQTKKKQPITVQMAMWSARHHWLVVALWFILTLGLFSTSLILGNKTNSPADSRDERKTESAQGQAILKESGLKEQQSLTVVFKKDAVNVNDPDFQKTVTDLSGKLRNLTYSDNGQQKAAFVQVLDYYALPSPALRPQFASADHTTTIINAQVASGDYDASKAPMQAARQVIDDFKGQHKDYTIYALNNTYISDEFFQVLNDDLQGSLIITLPVTFLILLLAFGAVIAAFIPLVLAATALAAAYGISSIYSYTIHPIDNTATQLVTLIGLAVGIDYTLFILTRYRSERRRGKDKDTALQISSSTAGRAVFFSGITVMISLAGLLIIGDPLFASMAILTIVVVLVAVIGSLTFLPAVIALLGDNVDRGRIPYFGREREEGTGVWSHIVKVVMRRPVALTILVLVVLLTMASPLLHIRFGSTTADLSDFPETMQTVRAYKLLKDEFPTTGSRLTLAVVIQSTKADLTDPQTAATIKNFQQAVLSIPSLSNPTIESTPNPRVEQLVFTMQGSGNDQVNQDIVKKVRQEIIPSSFSATTGINTYVTSEPAFILDNNNTFIQAIPKIFLFVLTLSFLLLLVAFRSIIIPLKAIILNLLSTCAAYGILVLVVEDGWLASTLGFKTNTIIEAFLPVLLFTILFGLSMDYHLFILTRIKEGRDKGLSSNDAVAQGIMATSGTITSAATIMVSVFAVFVGLHLAVVKQLGLGLAVAVLVDATVIRSILLPTSMRLLGDWNWYLPGFLSWLPHVTIEGGTDDEQIDEANIAESERAFAEIN